MRVCWLVLLLCFGAASCEDRPTWTVDGKYTCEDDAGCPADWVCHEGLCVSVAPVTPGCIDAECDDSDPCTVDLCLDDACRSHPASSCALEGDWLFVQVGVDETPDEDVAVAYRDAFERLTFGADGLGQSSTLTALSTDAPVSVTWSESTSAEVSASATTPEFICQAVGATWQDAGGASWNPAHRGVVCRRTPGPAEEESSSSVPTMPGLPGTDDEGDPTLRSWRGQMTIDGKAAALETKGHVGLMFALPTDASPDALAGTWRVLGIESLDELETGLPPIVWLPDQLAEIGTPFFGWTGSVTWTTEGGMACLDTTASSLLPDRVLHEADGAPQTSEVTLAGPEGEATCTSVAPNGSFRLELTQADEGTFERTVTWLGWLSATGDLAVVSTWYLPTSAFNLNPPPSDIRRLANVTVLIRVPTSPALPGAHDGRWVLSTMARDKQVADVVTSTTGWLDLTGAVAGPGLLKRTTLGVNFVNEDDAISVADLDATGTFVSGDSGQHTLTWMGGPEVAISSVSATTLGKTPLFAGFHHHTDGMAQTPGLFFGVWAAPLGGWPAAD